MPSRVPAVDDRVLVRRLASTEPATVVAARGTAVDVVTDAGAALTFVLHPLTVRWVLQGSPSYGPRLQLDGFDEDDAV